MSAGDTYLESVGSYMAIIWNACSKRVHQSPTERRMIWNL